MNTLHVGYCTPLLARAFVDQPEFLERIKILNTELLKIYSVCRKY